jgi:hypothetical protein
VAPETGFTSGRADDLSLPLEPDPSSLGCSPRVAVAIARGDVLIQPAIDTATPKPTRIHQAAWLDSASRPNEPWAPEVPTTPMIATPRDEPTCLAVDEVAAATPD